MKQFFNKHRGQRAFIAANGPGLNDIDVTKLHNEVVFGLNRGYLKEGLPITYLLVVNPKVERQFGSEILASNKVVFSHGLSNSHHFKWTGDVPSFQRDATKPMWQGHTVTYCAMQLAYYMGINRLYVIGLDHSYDYSTSKKAKKGGGVVSVENDPNHFSPDYWGKGVQWDPANLTRSALAYGLARQAFEGDGREIYNASATTQLPEDVLPRIGFDEIDFIER